jgi:hypothetical protein
MRVLELPPSESWERGKRAEEDRRVQKSAIVYSRVEKSARGKNGFMVRCQGDQV